MNPLANLHLITNKLLNTAADAYGDLWTLTRELHDFLFRVIDVNPDESTNRQNGQHLDSGNAIGLTWAALCIQDIMRTKKIMDGLYQAVLDVQAEERRTPIHVLYAGTGPFTTLISPLLARFTSQQIQFTLLEVNPETYGCLVNLVAVLNVGQYIRNVHLADAATWRVTPNEPVAIFLTETMVRALKTEPQVAICLNILPQLSADTLLIPEEIRLRVGTSCLPESNQEGMSPQPIAKLVANVVRLNKATIRQNAEAYKWAGIPFLFPATTVSMPSYVVSSSSGLGIFTEITVYKRFCLNDNESGLTTAHFLNQSRTAIPPSLTFQYRVDKVPGLDTTPSL